MKSLKRFSTSKFYEIVAEQNIQIMPEIPQDVVLSKHITQQQTATNRQSSFRKQQSKQLSYSELLNGSPYGSVQNFFHRNQELTLVSTNYFRVNQQKIHKLILNAKPDVIVVQRRPEYHYHNFQTITKGQDGVFNDRMYLNGLMFTPESIRPDIPSMRPLVNALNKSKDDVLEPQAQKQILQQKGFDTCIKYASAYRTPLYFGEMPMRVYRQWIVNSHTLMELQQIFKVVCHRLPRYKNLSLTPYQMGTFIYPQIFLKLNDIYMATVIEMLIATKKYKKIVGLFGITQNQAVKHRLQKDQAMNPIIQYLIPSRPKGSIVRDIQQFEIIQKQIILDVFFYGQKVMQTKLQTLHTTNSTIQKYGHGIDKQTMLKFRYDKTMQYLNLMEQKLKDGQNEIQKQFVRAALRENKN